MSVSIYVSTSLYLCLDRYIHTYIVDISKNIGVKMAITLLERAIQLLTILFSRSLDVLQYIQALVKTL